MSIRIEYLFPEFAGLFGDIWNIRYLKECMPEAEFIDTAFTDEPAFLKGDVQMVYMGGMTESQQELVIEKLLPYRDRILQLIEGGTVFLMTANAGEVFASYIERDDGSRVTALGVYDLYAKRDMMHRFHTMVLGEFEGMKLVGFKAQFSQLYGDNSDHAFVKITRGCGINPDSMLEGVRIKNFFATSIVGPVFLMNPLLVKYFMELLGVSAPKLAHEEVIMSAYKARLAQFEDPATKY